MTREFRNSALAGAVLGVAVFVGLTGVAFYDGMKSTAKAVAPVLAQPAQAVDQTPMRHRKANKLDQRQVRQLPLGRVLSWDQSSVI